MYDATSNLILPSEYERGDRPQGLTPWVEETLASVEAYAREQPWAFGLCMLGIGFVLGWRLKIW